MSFLPAKTVILTIVKKILIFSLAYYPFVGGDGVAIKEITKRIDPKEIEFHMVTLRFDSKLPTLEKIGNVTVHRIGWTYGSATTATMRALRFRIIKLWFQFGAAWYGLALDRKEKFDAVWSMMAHSAGVPGAIFKFFRPQAGFVLTLQEGDPPEHVERVMRPLWLLFARAFTAADVVQPISVFLGEWARRRGFRGPLEVIPNGVDTENFARAYPQDELESLKDSLGKKDDDVFLVTTSRLVRKNAVDDVIRALSFLPEHIQFLILGVGSEEDTLRSLAKGLGVESRVKFLGFVDHVEMPKYLRVSDIFVRPSRSEGMGNSFIEAMAAGLPVIATQEGGIADFLFDAKRNPEKQTTGWAVNRDGPQEIARAVEDILSDNKATSRVIETARAMATETYDWDFIARQMREKVFEQAFIQAI